MSLNFPSIGEGSYRIFSPVSGASDPAGTGDSGTLPLSGEAAPEDQYVPSGSLAPDSAPSYSPAAGGNSGKSETDGVKGSSKVSGPHECKTCAARKYQDVSGDPGVSFKSAAHVSPEAAASAVRGHESEHVFREQVKAKSEHRVVVSQNVAISTDICPECGRIYVSGGKTTTVTKSVPDTPYTPPSAGSGQNINIKV